MQTGKDAIPTTIRSFPQTSGQTLESMSDADPEIVIHSIWTWWAYIFDSTSLKEVWISLFWLYLQIAREAAQTRGTRTHHWHIWSHLWGTFTLGHGSCQPQFSSQGQWPGNFKNHDAECSLTPCADAHSGRFLGSDGRQATKDNRGRTPVEDWEDGAPQAQCSVLGPWAKEWANENPHCSCVVKTLT